MSISWCALTYFYDYKKNVRNIIPEDSMKSSLLGYSYSYSDVETFLNKRNIEYQKFEYDKLYDKVANYINSDFVIGWYQGKSEFGPRSLGNRSILANPMSPDCKKTI